VLRSILITHGSLFFISLNFDEMSSDLDKAFHSFPLSLISWTLRHVLQKYAWDDLSRGVHFFACWKKNYAYAGPFPGCLGLAQRTI